MYVLRCFYGESQETGEDLKAEIRRYAEATEAEQKSPPTFTAARIALTLAAVLFTTAPISAQSVAQTPSQSGQPFPRGGAASEELNEKIREVMQQRKYTWRMPRQNLNEAETENGMMARVRGWLRAQRDRIIEWIRRFFGRHGRTREVSGSGYGWIVVLQVLLYGLVGLVIIALAWLLYSVLRNRKRTVTIASQPIQPAPDLTDENVGVDQLPEDGWSKLGRELLGRGELRLAMRAFYLASLAHLAGRNLITLAKFKSNRDYEHELRRRGHALAELPGLFGENVSVLDQTWYGMHEVTEELVNQFIARVERLRSPQPANQSTA